MNCKLCNKENKNSINLLGTNICKDCFLEIATISITNEKYEYYKEKIKMILKKYIYYKTILTP